MYKLINFIEKLINISQNDFINSVNILDSSELSFFKSLATDEQNQFLQKIQNTLTHLKSNLSSDTQKALLEADLSTLKQQLQSSGYGELLEGPVVEQIEQLIIALKNQQLAAIGQTFETLAASFDDTEKAPDTAELIASLEQHIPKPYFDQIEPRLKHAKPHLLSRTLRGVAQKLKATPDNINLDAIVQEFEQDLGNLFGKDEAQKETERIENYRLSARQAILKSLKANGIQHPD